jgi:hypothetical protein
MFLLKKENENLKAELMKVCSKIDELEKRLNQQGK